MESLRNFLTGPRLIFVVLVCAVPFVFLGTGSLQTAFTGSFGSINGEDVTENDIQIAANSAVSRFKSIYGDEFDFDSLDEAIRSDAIKQELILQKVLLSGARSLGFVNDVSNIEAQKGIIRTPQFQIDGVFDENVYEAQVNSNGFTKEGYLDAMTELYASEIYRDSLTRFNFVTEKEIYELTALFEQSSDLDFTKISFEGLKSEIVNTLDELKNFYEENQVLFYTNEKRGFKYFIVEQSDYEDSVEIPSDYIETAYQQYLDRAVNQAEIRFAHIMIDKNNYDDSGAAFDAIKVIETKLDAGDDFSSLANQFSEDLITKDNGGDLEYFEKDIYPVEFDNAIEQMELNDYSDIIELPDTYHILKITEYTEQDPLPEDQIKDNLKKELIETESFALMNDDFSNLEDMLLDNSSIEEIANEISKELLSSDLYSIESYDFEINEPAIKENLFSNEITLDQPIAIESGDMIIFMAYDRLEEPYLKTFQDVAEDAADYLSESKAIEKISLLQEEILENSETDDSKSFVDTYGYVSQESYVDVKRYSSLLPREVLREIFDSSSGSTLNLSANNGDRYIINLNSFTKPSEEDIQEIINEYTAFGEDSFATKMQQIINEDIFQKADENLNDLLQF